MQETTRIELKTHCTFSYNYRLINQNQTVYRNSWIIMSNRSDEPMVNQQKHIARPSSLYDSIVSVAVVPSWIRHIKESSTINYMLMAPIVCLRIFVY